MHRLAGISLTELLRAWVRGDRVKLSLKSLSVEAAGNRTRVDGHLLVPTRELLKIREFKRFLNSDLREAVKSRGWTTPIHVILGKDGTMMVAEGNHRVAVAEFLEVEELPVVVHLREKTRGERLTNADLDYQGMLDFEKRWGDPEWREY